MKRYTANIPYVDYYPAMADAEKLPNLFRRSPSQQSRLSGVEPLVENTIQIALDTQ
jgi:hypothetical protein